MLLMGGGSELTIGIHKVQLTGESSESNWGGICGN